MIIYELTPIALVPKYYATEDLAKRTADQVLVSYYQHNANLDKKYVEEDHENISMDDLYIRGLVRYLQWEEVDETFSIGGSEHKTGRTMLRALVSDSTEDDEYQEYIYIKKIEVVDE